MPMKYTARGTKRLTKQQRSNVMKRAWAKRRKNGTAQPKVRKSKANPKRSKAMKASWRRRQLAGDIPPKKSKVLLSASERSEIATRAAARRTAGAPKRLRADRKLLGMPGASRTQLRLAFEASRKRLRLPRRSTLDSIRKALRIEKDGKPEGNAVAPVEVRAAA